MLGEKVVEKKKADFSALWLTEDWWTVWLGGIMLLLAAVGIVNYVPKLPKWAAIADALPNSLLPGILVMGACIAVITGIAVAVMRKNVKAYLRGYPLIFSLAVLAYVIGNQTTLNFYGFNDVIWALVLGMVVSNVFGKPSWLKPALQSELFIKTGLVLMGAEILFTRVLTLGVYGLGVAWLVTPIVVTFMYWYGTRVLKIKSKSLVATVAACTSVCGVSAAIAAGSATRAKKEEIGLAISVSLIFTIIMMLGLPVLIRWFGLNEAVGGAWIGGTVDSTGAVVVAGSMVGPLAMEVAAVVKMLQNTLIGFVAFVMATLFITRVDRDPNQKKVGLMEIWVRFPKFILGFIAASLTFSFVLVPLLGNSGVDTVLKTTTALRSWLFCLAFVSFGLDSKFSDMAKTSNGSAPVKLYVIGQTFNLVLTLLAAWYFFSGNFFTPII